MRRTRGRGRLGPALRMPLVTLVAVVGLAVAAFVGADTPHGGSWSPPRSVITLEGTTNLRDVAGYTGMGGKVIRPGQVYRSAHLAGLTKAGNARLSQLKLHTVVDFRIPDEIDLYGKDVTPSGVMQVPEPVAKQPLGHLPTDNQIIGAYRQFVSDPAKRASFGATLALIADSGQRPILMHCDSGVTRTGWAAAILLTALGVSRDQVERDYEVSNAYIPGGYAKQVYLDASFAEVDARYGSFDSFLIHGLGVTTEQLTQLRTELLQ